MAAPFKGPTRAMASAAAVRTPSSRSCNRGTSAGTAEAAAQIFASATQQATGMGQINQAMKSIEQVTRQNVASLRQIEQAAQNLNTLSNQLGELSAKRQ